MQLQIIIKIYELDLVTLDYKSIDYNILLGLIHY